MQTEKEDENIPLKPARDSAASTASIGRAVGRKSSRAAQNANQTVFADVAFHPKFENFTLIVIVLNALWLFVDTQFNHAAMKDEAGKMPLEPYSVIVENCFCAYFTFEVVVRFLAYKQKINCIWDGFFVFDTVLVLLMIIETWIVQIGTKIAGSSNSSDILASFSVLRLMRLLRLARMARLMRAVPELLTLVKGMFKAAKAVVWIFVLLFALLYMFGIMFTSAFLTTPKTRPEGYLEELSATTVNHLSPHLQPLSALVQTPAPDPAACEEEGEDTGGDLFATLGDSMMNLLTRGVLGDNLQETCDAIKAESLVMQAIFFVFFGLTFALLLNMLIGVLCEVVSASAKEEENMMNVSYLKSTIKEAFQGLDVNKDGVVCQEEWQQIKSKPKVRESMLDMGMEESRIDAQLDQMQDVIFYDVELQQKASDSLESRRVSVSGDGRLGVTVDQLMESMCEVRPGQDASALDFEILKINYKANLNTFSKQLDRIEQHVRTAMGPNFDEGDLSRPLSADDVRPSQPESVRESEVERTPSATQSGSVGDLKAIPTEVLFRELQRRTAPQPGVVLGPGCRHAGR